MLLVACGIGLATGTSSSPHAAGSGQLALTTQDLLQQLHSGLSSCHVFCVQCCYQHHTAPSRQSVPDLMHLCLNLWRSLAGAGVVVFNNVIHEIRSSLWHSTPSDATSWAYWARDLPISARWNSLLLPPVLGGLAVGLLRKVSGGFDNPPDEQQQQHSQTTSTSTTTASSSEQKPQNNSRAAATSRASAARTQERSASAPSTSTPDTDFETVSRLSSSQEASTSGGSTLWSLPWVTSGSRSLKQRLLRVIRPLLKATAAAITLGTGNSLGPEGPSVEIGRAAARGLGNVLKSKQRRLLSLVAAGSGAGKCASSLICSACRCCSSPSQRILVCMHCSRTTAHRHGTWMQKCCSTYITILVCWQPVHSSKPAFLIKECCCSMRCTCSTSESDHVHSQQLAIKRSTHSTLPKALQLNAIDAHFSMQVWLLASMPPSQASSSQWRQSCKHKAATFAATVPTQHLV